MDKYQEAIVRLDDGTLFSVWINFDHEQFDAAVVNWALRTNVHAADSLCNYINDKGTDHRCFKTNPEFNRSKERRVGDVVWTVRNNVPQQFKIERIEVGKPFEDEPADVFCHWTDKYRNPRQCKSTWAFDDLTELANAVIRRAIYL